MAVAIGGPLDSAGTARAGRSSRRQSHEPVSVRPPPRRPVRCAARRASPSSPWPRWR
jgi:hypothetical protein